MQPTQELIDDLWRDKIEQAQRMTEQQRLEAGGELFDYACRITSSGIRNQHPEWTDVQVLEELRRRIALAERIEENLEKLEL